MEEFDIYKDISERTLGDIYVGVVGPVRVGKSTFITKFMDTLVVPNIKSKHVKERMKDELPQSAAGKTIMTTQPKFVPNEAVVIKLRDNIDIKVRMVDCVGYMIEGAEGHMDGGKPRMVKTPWSDEEISFEKAADIGTRKVISEHSTIGILMTTDGSISTDIPRGAYVAAEERVVKELKELGKPFVIVLNSTVPTSAETKKLAKSLVEKYDTPVLPLDVVNLTEKDINEILEKVLFEFPLVSIDFKINKWLQALPMDNKIISSMISTLTEKSQTMCKMSDWTKMDKSFEGSEYFAEVVLDKIMLGQGKIMYSITPQPNLFYSALSEECQMTVEDDFQLMSHMKSLVHAKREYDKLSSALEEVKNTGYGVVTPSLEDMTLDEPQIVRQGARYGVKLKATAPSLHIMRVDIQAEVSPIVGTEQQGEEMVKNLLADFENDPKSLWETNMFGKSLHMMVSDGITNKLMAMPNDTQKKMRRTLSRIVNEGKGGVICILL